ncbi:MAG TPA: DUF1015 domain-containing protein [Kofleriaceae bacterium]|nr:DUF1015 domain-containing protein [Kofleriaceae bacterium]
MPDIAGFHALTYDPSRVELSDVVTPPYDVIDPQQRSQLADRDRHNFVHVDLPEPGPGEDRYHAAAERLARWRAEGILRHDSSSAVYRYHQVFRDQERGITVTRKGVLAAVSLSPWREGVIRPHETTFAAPREDRARLLDATRVHLSPVFAMYDGAGAEVEEMFAECTPTPDLDATTADGTRHQVWRIAAPHVIGRLSQFMIRKRAYVLDGHHRYETMAAFAERERGRGAVGPQRGPMFLVAIDDPGLVILPTHRIVAGIPGLTRESFLGEIQRHAEIRKLTGGARDAARLQHALHGTRDVAMFAAVFCQDPDAYVLSLRSREFQSRLDSEISVLHDVVLGNVLGIHADAQKTNLRHVSNTQAALDQVAAGNGQLGLIVRPPELAQIVRLADLGRVMPQKSTYFYPKLASGLVMMPVE